MSVFVYICICEMKRVGVEKLLVNCLLVGF